MRVNTGSDFQARAMGGDSSVGDTGTATGTTATTLTDSGKSWTTNQWVGHVVFAAAVYGVVVSNTATALTVDKWYAPATPGGSAGSTPGNVAYVVSSAQGPAWWMGLTTNNGAASASDTTMTGELTASGLGRALATFAHTTSATTYTLTKAYTSSDGTPRTIEKIGIFQHSTGGSLVFETAVPSPPTLVSGDQLTVTETVTI